MKVGQTVYVKPVGNAARRSKEIIEAKVSKIGNKFFYLETPGVYNRFSGLRFFIEDLSHDGKGYISDYQVYLSEQEIKDEKTANHLHDEIRKRFSYYYPSLPLDKLKKIHEIINS